MVSHMAQRPDTLFKTGTALCLLMMTGLLKPLAGCFEDNEVVVHGDGVVDTGDEYQPESTLIDGGLKQEPFAREPCGGGHASEPEKANE